MTPAQIKNFVAFVETTPIGYHQANKNRFRREATAILRQIAKAMGLAKGTYEVRFNPGGIAVSGEAVLHSDPIDGRGGIYVNLADGLQFYYRSVKSRKDYTGGRNRWMLHKVLADVTKVADIFKAAALENN